MPWSKYYTYPVDNSYSYNETVVLEEVSIQNNILEIYSFDKKDDINLNDYYNMDNIFKSDLTLPAIKLPKVFNTKYFNSNYSLKNDLQTTEGITDYHKAIDEED